MVADAVLLALLALVFDALLGEPKGLYRRLPHPIVVMGRLAARWEARFNRTGLKDAARALLGGLGLILLILGVIAPLFWCLIGGLPALMAYKAVNTLDSLWGHRTARYLWFGKAAARLDDLVNLIPARLTALLVALAAVPRSLVVIRLSLRDAPYHRSPNAGWPEAAFAAALHLKLGGPRTYPQEGEIDAATLGEGRANVTSSDIDRALRLYRRTLILTALLLALGAALVWIF